MSETENTDVASKFLDGKLKLGKEIDEAQRAARVALQLACESGTAEQILELAVSVKTIDKAWHINQEQVREFWNAKPKNDVLFSDVKTSDNIYHAAKYSKDEE